MALAEIGQEAALAGGQFGERGQAKNDHQAHDRARPAGNEAQQRAINGLERVLQAGLGRTSDAPVEEEVSQRRRDGERDQEGGHDGQDVAQGQRRKEAALQARQRQNGQKDERDNEGRINHRAADFQRRSEHHLENLARTGPAGGGQAPKDVFHVDD